MFPLHYVAYVLIIAAGFTTGCSRLCRHTTIRPVIALLGITCCSEILSKILTITMRNNIPVYQVYHPVQIFLWCLFFYRNMHSGWKRTVPLLGVALLLFAVLNIMFLQPFHTFPGNLIKLESVVLLFWSFCLFSEFLDLPARENIFRQSAFIICIAVMWFNLVSYLFFEVFSYYSSTPALLYLVRSIHLFSNYIYYGLLLASMFLKADSFSHE